MKNRQTKSSRQFLKLALMVFILSTILAFATWLWGWLGFAIGGLALVVLFLLWYFSGPRDGPGGTPNIRSNTRAQDPIYTSMGM